MFKGFKNIFKGVYSSKALKNSFIVNYHRYLQEENEGISSIIESQSENVFNAVLNDVENKFSQIANQKTRIDQIFETRRTILEYLEERIQSLIYFDKKWTEEKRSKIGKHLLPDIEEAIIPEQERNIYIISTIAFFVFYLVSAELYKDNNNWIGDYTNIYSIAVLL